MRNPVCYLALLIALVVASASHAQNAPVTLDRLVPADRQKQLGFDKLSPEQRAGVVQLLQEVYQLGRQEGQKASAAPQSKPAAPAPSVIETQIDGDFEGWEGETIVKLMNGQIWQQTEYHYHYHYAFMPKVLIYRNGGGYKMKVDGVDKAVGVERLR
jgi:hypothetical protein